MSSFRNLVLLAFLSVVVSFTPIAPSAQHRRTLSPLRAKGGGAIATPKTATKTATTTKSKTKETTKQKQDFKVHDGDQDTDIEEAPLWMLFLIGDKGYEQAHVTSRLAQIVQDMNEKNAIAVYDAAQRVGEALCGKYPHEHAEMFCEQLTRSDPIIYAEIREDKTDD
ncbi:hypothetical protein ACHAW6_000503 [Cyclotella cf. meneghiniana]